MTKSYNPKTALAAIAIVSALALAIAPVLLESALAKKQEVITCPSGKPCPNENVEEKNRNVEEECRAGRDLHNTNANCPN
jgi:hypothetical protein